jgi:DNA-binding transcriptional MerR regulator
MLEKTASDTGTVLLTSQLPPIPSKRYFTIGEVADLCGVRSHVLRYWEQEFSQLSPQKRRGNRRYYQHHEVVLIRKIRALLYEEGFTIGGARNRLDEARGELRLRDELQAVLQILSK